MSSAYGGGAKCPRCDKTVYFNEEVVAAGKKWHKNCFKCKGCKKALDSMTMAQHEGELYCKECHKKDFANFKMAPAAEIKETTVGGGPRCGKCSKPVYHNEKVLGAGKEWHKDCFLCADCRKRLDSTTVAEHEGQIYCKPCHKKRYGLKGYGYGQGAGTLAMDGAIEAGPPLDLPSTSTGQKTAFGGADKCGMCGKSVYHAERVVGAGKTWHKLCFKCQNCNKSLDSTTVRDREGAIFCKGCYGKNFGPKGYGYGQGAGALPITK